MYGKEIRFPYFSPFPCPNAVEKYKVGSINLQLSTNFLKHTQMILTNLYLIIESTMLQDCISVFKYIFFILVPRKHIFFIGIEGKHLIYKIFQSLLITKGER